MGIFKPESTKEDKMVAVIPTLIVIHDDRFKPKWRWGIWWFWWVFIIFVCILSVTHLLNELIKALKIKWSNQYLRISDTGVANTAGLNSGKLTKQ